MGYYTYHTLKWRFHPESLGEVPPIYVQTFLDHLRAKTDDYVDFDENGYPTNNEGWKWYSHNDDMLEVSRMFPIILFSLYGDGEESDDNWVQYYLNGKTYSIYASLGFPEFDERQLVENGGEV